MTPRRSSTRGLLRHHRLDGAGRRHGRVGRQHSGQTVTVARRVRGRRATPVKVRLHFLSDTAWSDQDGRWPTNGAAHFDNLKVEGLPIGGLRGEAVGAQQTERLARHSAPLRATATTWPSSRAQPRFSRIRARGPLVPVGIHQRTRPRPTPAAVSTAAGGARSTTRAGQYISTTRSGRRTFPIIGSGRGRPDRVLVYRDLPLDNLVFYVWHVRRSWPDCPGRVGGSELRLLRWSEGLVPATSRCCRRTCSTSARRVGMQVALGVIDMCWVWCGVYGTGDCHSHAPLIDNVTVYRINDSGPQWTIRDIDQFQDNFAGRWHADRHRPRRHGEGHPAEHQPPHSSRATRRWCR